MTIPIDELAPIFQKKTMAKLSLNTAEAAASKPSGFAVRMLEKFGWKEGEGLGKEKQGIATHVKVVKKDDNKGIGCKGNGEDFSNAWWDNAFKSAAANIGGVSASDSSDDSDSDHSVDDEMKVSLDRDMSTYTEEDIKLFKACGGRRCGKRAGRAQPGKWKREQAADEEFLKKYQKIADPTKKPGDQQVLRKVMVNTAIVKVEDKIVVDQEELKRIKKEKKKLKKAKKARKEKKKKKRKAEELTPEGNIDSSMDEPKEKKVKVSGETEMKKKKSKKEKKSKKKKSKKD